MPSSDMSEERRAGFDAVDCSANVYARGGHLLCHDDVIGDRLVSYVLYLTEPEGWSADDGGSFEFYGLGADGEPESAPCARVAPASWRPSHGES